MTEGSPIPTWYDFAHAEIGQKEIPGVKANPRIVEYLSVTPLAQGGLSDETPWCSSFVNWAFKKAGVQGTLSAAAKSWVTWGEERTPRVGAAVVLKKKSGKSEMTSSGYHVGFFVSQVKGKTITILGGNQSNSVSKSTFPLSKWEIVAVRWPMESRNATC